MKHVGDVLETEADAAYKSDTPGVASASALNRYGGKCATRERTSDCLARIASEHQVVRVVDHLHVQVELRLSEILHLQTRRWVAQQAAIGIFTSN